MDERTCARCHLVKSVDGFSIDRRDPSGRFYACKVCENARVKAYRVANLERVRLRDRQRHGPARVAKMIAYRAANLDHYLEKERRFKEANRDRINAKNRAKYAADPTAVKSQHNVRRARLLQSTTGPIDHALVAHKVAYWGGRCWMCGGPFQHMDHVKPLSKGGAHLLSNLRPACKSCNSRKKDRWPWPTGCPSRS